jgi:hypothetical protein
LSLPKQIADREYQKFVEDLAGNVAIRVAPGAITDSVDGNELDIDKNRRARVYDEHGLRMMKNIHDVLERILWQLELMNG